MMTLILFLQYFPLLSITHVAGATCVIKVFHFKKTKNKKKALFNEQDFHLQNIYDDFDLVAPVLPLFKHHTRSSSYVCDEQKSKRRPFLMNKIFIFKIYMMTLIWKKAAAVLYRPLFCF